jgi:predicted SprT family Zn-dependent metalloprotease
MLLCSDRPMFQKLGRTKQTTAVEPNLSFLQFGKEIGVAYFQRLHRRLARQRVNI